MRQLHLIHVKIILLLNDTSSFLKIQTNRLLTCGTILKKTRSTLLYGIRASLNDLNKAILLSSFFYRNWIWCKTKTEEVWTKGGEWMLEMEVDTELNEKELVGTSASPEGRRAGRGPWRIVQIVAAITNQELQELTTWHDRKAKKNIHGCHLHWEWPSTNLHGQGP